MGRKGAVVAAGVAAVLLSAFASTARADAPTLFDGAGVFIDNTLDFPGPGTLADELEANHFSWVALHVESLADVVNMPAIWIQVMRAHGLKVGLWGTASTDPIVSAVFASEAVQALGLDFYVADAENPYESRGKWRSAMFVSEFRQLEPTLPAGLVTLGDAQAPWVLPIDFASWRDNGFALLPEAYYNQYPGYRPDLTVQHAIRAGWSVADVHPVIGVYHHYAAANYVPLLENDGGTTGFSVFLADQMTPADFAALSGLAAAG
jgi:hypothetical protein